jgi:predicted transcriptional regulator
MSPPPNPEDPILAMCATVLAAYVGHHEVPQSDLPGLAKTIYQSLAKASQDERTAVGKAPAVAVDRSITDSHLICLEDGKRFQSLKRHLRVAFGLTPQAYREKWGLPDDYPMVSPAYARRRSELAKQSGLGKSG